MGWTISSRKQIPVTQFQATGIKDRWILPAELWWPSYCCHQCNFFTCKLESNCRLAGRSYCKDPSYWDLRRAPPSKVREKFTWTFKGHVSFFWMVQVWAEMDRHPINLYMQMVQHNGVYMFMTRPTGYNHNVFIVRTTC